MYNKDLSEDLRLRLSKTDMEFLRKLSNERAVTISECIRSIIGEYRRSVDAIQTLQRLAALTQKEGGGLSDGDTKADINNKL